MKEAVEKIINALADNKDAVEVSETSSDKDNRDRSARG